MKTYQYNGAFTVDVIGGKEITLQNGKTYDFDEKNERVKTLVKLSKLTAVKKAKAENKTETKETERTK